MTDPFDGFAGMNDVGSGQQVPPTPDGGQGQGHPAWQEYLTDIPQEYHGKITPAFQKWDSEVQNKLQKVHSTYEPWKPLIDAGIEPDQAQFALQILNSINETPEMVYNAIGEYYGLSKKEAKELVEQGQNGGSPGDPSGESNESDPYDPRITEVERQNKIIAQALLDAQQREADAEADYELEQEFGQVYNKYGQLDEVTEKIILGLMNSDGSLSAPEAADLYFSNLERSGRAKAPRPLIMGSGGGAPGTGVDVKKLDDKGTRNLVEQMLQAAAAQRG